MNHVQELQALVSSGRLGPKTVVTGRAALGKMQEGMADICVVCWLDLVRP
ncbi:MAG: hypothetical protein M3495_05600 [Pseudomonadota bacterium]|nr:hypothetical protein [Gammaproteobacteria bacterium]MDQ3581105.1 hypothetical protein [Pseudomonadota bacterium]